ncbi:MAG TPA: bacillithiol transferase BstA [Bryobacteraceae bacterium]|nr:bacillithiol transferase BstA [Bryobacteraceae bacterium]
MSQVASFSNEAEADLRYPVGRFQPSPTCTPADRAIWIEELEALPRRVRDAVHGLNDSQLDTPYRPDGWTVRQVVHHLPDGHINGYARFRLAVTENAPVTKAYNEKQWAELPDARLAPVEPSLNFLDGLHARWVLLLRSLTDEQFKRVFSIPGRGDFTLEGALALYAWHSRHHVAHIQRLRERMGW